jgi:D-xylulose reductase
MEPLSVGVHAVAKLGDFRASQCVVVFGCGPVGSHLCALPLQMLRSHLHHSGLLCMAVAKALGASRIIAVDIIPNRLAFAKGYAATDIYTPPPLGAEESTSDYSRRNAANMKRELGIDDHGPRGVDLVVDARSLVYSSHFPQLTCIAVKSGAEVSIQTAIFVVKAGGTFVQVWDSIRSSTNIPI